MESGQKIYEKKFPIILMVFLRVLKHIVIFVIVSALVLIVFNILLRYFDYFTELSILRIIKFAAILLFIFGWFVGGFLVIMNRARIKRYKAGKVKIGKAKIGLAVGVYFIVCSTIVSVLTIYSFWNTVAID